MGKLVRLNTSAINYSTCSFWFSLLSWLVPPLSTSWPTPTVQLLPLRPPRPKLPTLPPRESMPPITDTTATTDMPATPMLMVHGPVTTVMPVTPMPIPEHNLSMASLLTPTVPLSLLMLPM